MIGWRGRAVPLGQPWTSPSRPRDIVPSERAPPRTAVLSLLRCEMMGVTRLADTIGDRAPDPEVLLGKGATIGRYVITDNLGAGGMGVVYAA